MNTERKTINISRYSSRRLYNTSTSDYVTVDELAELIHQGFDIKVVDKKSGEDITCQILLQIIADQEAESGGVLPANILTDIIRNSSGENGKVLPKFLSETFERLNEHRGRISGSIREQIANPLDPQKALNSFEAWRDAQNDVLNSVFSAWLPDKSKRKETTEKQHETKASEMVSELDLLKKQIEEMQGKIQDLESK